MTSYKHRLAAWVLGMAILPVTAAPQKAPSIDTSFQEFWTAAQGQPFEKQEALWDEFIEQPRQEFYDQVVWEKRDRPTWQKEKDLQLKARFTKYPTISAEVTPATRALEALIPLQVARFRRIFPDAPANPLVVVTLSPNFNCKTGILSDGTPVLALAIDTITLQKADMSIHLPHELFHYYDAIHAGINNDGVMPGTNLTLPLFEEGFAVYVASLVSPGHTDAQYLSQDNLGSLAASRLPEAAKRFLQTADRPTVDPANNSMNYARWFEGNSTPYQADLPNRSGYWLGLNLLRRMAKTHTLSEMSTWGPIVAQRETLAALKAMAGSN